MPRDQYQWLATLSRLAAKDRQPAKPHRIDDDDDQGGLAISKVTALVGVIRDADRGAANDLLAVLIILCQTTRRNVQTLLVIALLCQMRKSRAKLWKPSGGAALPGLSRHFPLCQMISTPTAPCLCRPGRFCVQGPVAQAASGCAAGTASRKASSLWQAASMALIRGHWAMSTLKRRALSTWGIRYTSAIDGVWPKQ